MCGIAGEINYTGDFRPQTDVYEKMKDLLKNRGPSQEGIYHFGQGALIHTRLTVVDIEHGIQPMQFSCGDKAYSLIYNGEIYNTEELREKLTYKGYTFTGHSDTEVLLKCYVEWGKDCLPMLNGIFAFAVWERHNRRLFFARDRIGVKPFFYTETNGSLIFGSEIKAILAHPRVKSRIDCHSIAEIMLIGPGRTPGYGVFQNINELSAGSYGYYSNDGLEIHKYWELSDGIHTDTFEQTVEKVRYLVLDAIEKQLVSDVPICTFLSGGLDSSIISAVASQKQKEQGERLNTFSVDYLDNDKYFKKSKFQPNSDDHYIKAMQKDLDSNHTSMMINTDELVSALFQAVDARDLPGMADVDASLLLFCERVKEHSTVALSGECADEIFGGYPWYRDKTIRSQEGFPWSQSTAFRYGFLKKEFADKINPQKYVSDRYQNTLDQTSKIEGLSPLESRMKEMIRLNMDWFMQTLLDRKDRMSMYSGLEVRVPFCDYRIVEYLYTVPWEMKNYQNREKGLLRKAVEGLLPDEVLWRVKSPYPKTHNPQYLAAVSKLLKEIIQDDTSPLLQFVKKSELEKLIQSDNPIPWYGQLMTTPQTIAYFIQTNYWLQKYNISIV